MHRIYAHVFARRYAFFSFLLMTILLSLIISLIIWHSDILVAVIKAAE